MKNHVLSQIIHSHSSKEKKFKKLGIEDELKIIESKRIEKEKQKQLNKKNTNGLDTIENEQINNNQNLTIQQTEMTVFVGAQQDTQQITDRSARRHQTQIQLGRDNDKCTPTISHNKQKSLDVDLIANNNPKLPKPILRKKKSFLINIRNSIFSASKRKVMPFSFDQQDLENLQKQKSSQQSPIVNHNDYKSQILAEAQALALAESQMLGAQSQQIAPLAQQQQSQQEQSPNKKLTVQFKRGSEFEDVLYVQKYLKKKNTKCCVIF